jgi:hypothetical protein
MADNCDFEISMPVKVQGTLKASNDPGGVVAKSSAAEKGQKQPVVAIFY